MILTSTSDRCRVSSFPSPHRYALCDGGAAHGFAPPDWPPTNGSIALAAETPARNSSVFPVFGRDRDPRNPPEGYVFLHAGGDARRTGALFHVVRMPQVCSAISIRIEYGMSSSRGAPAKRSSDCRESTS